MHYRDDDAEKDRPAVQRLLMEVGWLEKGKEDAY